MKARHEPSATVITGPVANFESLTRTWSPVTVHSTHSPPAPLLYDDRNHTGRLPPSAPARLISELVSNIINHVGAGTPATLVVSMRGTRVRIEIHDPDTRALPTLLEATQDAEVGRGMALVSAVSDRWGVQLQADRKVTWCELPTALPSAEGHAGGARVNRVEGLLREYCCAQPHPWPAGHGAVTAGGEAAIDVMVDVLHWLRAHGRDPDEALDRVQNRFESETEDTEAFGGRQNGEARATTGVESVARTVGAEQPGQRSAVQ